MATEDPGENKNDLISPEDENTDTTFCETDKASEDTSFDILGEKENLLPHLQRNSIDNSEEIKGDAGDTTHCESDVEDLAEQGINTTPSNIIDNVHDTSNNNKAGQNSVTRKSVVEPIDIDSIDILANKENLPPHLQKNSTKNGAGPSRCEPCMEDVDEQGYNCDVDGFNEHLTMRSGRTSTPNNIDNVHDISNDSRNEPNAIDNASARSERPSSTSGSSSSSSSSSDGEDADDSVQDPDFVDHVGTDSASTETFDRSLEIPSPQPSTSNANNSNPTNPNNSNPNKGRKRVAAPRKWLQNKRKRLRNTGQAYTTNKKKEIPARCVKPACGETCRFKCSNKITEEERKQIFEEYWKMGDINRQRNYIHHKLVPIKRKYRYTTTQKGRDFNREFYLYIMGQKIRVCKKFFMRTLDINERVIRTVISKHTATGEIEDDLRGKHENQTRVPEEIKNSVRNHINSIPRIESHYLRQQTTREFIDGGKTIADLHRDYQEERTKYNLPFANYVLYAKIFNTEFNLGFFVPKKDLCELCDSYENATNNEKLNIEEKYNQHVLEKNLSRVEKSEDKNKVDDKYIVAIYDLQAVLPCPKGEISVFYYKSKLNTFNLTVTELGTKNTDCYLWHEGEGNRGSDEIGSCVYKYIEKKLTSPPSDNDSESEPLSNPNIELVFYSDSCCGQNKNQFIIALYIFSVLKFNKLRSITHKFLIPGHTQNENDSAHSVIEKEVKRNLKSGPIYVPYQYSQIIKTAKKQGQPYTVHELTHKDFMSLKKLQADLKFSMKGLKITEAKIIKYTKESPDVLLYKKSYSDTEFLELRIWRRTPDTPPELKPAYENGIELGSRKKADLLSLIRDNHIPQFYAPFYNSLLDL